VSQIQVWHGAIPFLKELLEHHPDVALVGGTDDLSLRFQQGDWAREVCIGDTATEVSGLVEVMDNNPMVCADVVSVPTPAATLALIALAPIIRATLLAEAPVLIYSFEVEESSIEAALARFDWPHGATIGEDAVEMGTARAMIALAKIHTPDRLDDLDDLYEEAYGRSFFVRRNEADDWHPDLVIGTPFAAYRLRITPGEPHSRLTIQVLADVHGKCGAAQVVHAMNVMAGLEESLGIPPILPSPTAG
jgi:N-acetyl-gamma-glutamylphosphate reductase